VAKKSRWWWLVGVGACVGASAACFAPRRPPPGTQPVPTTERVRATTAPGAPAHGPETELLARFDGFLKEQGDLEVTELWSRLHVTSPHAQALPFEPRSVPYFDTIARELKLTQGERELFGRQGFVRSGMAGADRARHSAGSAGVHA
jgi:hypothetical protein